MTKPSADHPSRSVSREQSLRRSFSAIISTGQRDDHDGRQESRRGQRRSRRSSLKEVLEQDPRDCHHPTRRVTNPANVVIVPVNDAGEDRRDPCRAIKLGGEEDLSGGRDEPALEKHAPKANPPKLVTTMKPTNKDGNEPVVRSCKTRQRRGAVGRRKLSPPPPHVEPSNPTPPGSSENLRGLLFPKPPFVKEHRHKGFRRDYQLGDPLRSPSDTVFQPTEAQAFHAASSLENYDFAFVKRSDGSFSYAILAYRSVELIRTGNGKARVECMNFVMCGEGTTKKVAQGKWSKCVRLPAKECLDDLSSRHQPPIRMILCMPQMKDECSMISNVSESDSVRRWRRMQTA